MIRSTVMVSKVSISVQPSKLQGAITPSPKVPRRNLRRRRRSSELPRELELDVPRVTGIDQDFIRIATINCIACAGVNPAST